MNAGNNYGTKLEDATEGAGGTQRQEFYSRTQGTNPPELVVTIG